MFKGGGKWSSNGCDGKKSSGGFIDVNGGVSKGGSLIVTHHDYSSNGYQGCNSTGGNQTQNSVVTSNYYGYGNSQGLGKLYTPEEVLGMSGHTKKNPHGDSETIDQIIDFSRRKSADCWGSNALHHGSGGKDSPQYIKAINLSRTDMHDRDSGNLFYVLRDFNFNLEILNLSNNRIGDLGVESMIYGITSLQYQTLYSAENGWKPYQSNLKTVQNVITINLSNNQIGDKGAELLAHYLAKGDLPSTKVIDVSGNKITANGYGMFIKSLKTLPQDIIVTLEKYTTSLGQKVIKPALKHFVKYATGQGVDTTDVATNKGAIEYLKDGAVISINMGLGLWKCSSTLVEILLLDTTAPSLAKSAALEMYGTKTAKKIDFRVCAALEIYDAVISPESVDLAVKTIDLLGDGE